MRMTACAVRNGGAAQQRLRQRDSYCQAPIVYATLAGFDQLQNKATVRQICVPHGSA
jgi:hypothetical protein